MAANTYGRQIVEALTNKSGGGVIAGDVVVISTGNDAAFTTDTAGAFTGMVGVAMETIANNAVGRVLTAGYAALVNVNASVTRGNFGKTHTVAKQAVDAGATRVVGVFCQFLTGGATPTAHLFGITDASTGAGGAPSGSKYIVGEADGTLSAEVVNQPLYDNFNPDKYPGSPNALDDEFEGGGAIDAKWTKVNDPAGGDALNQTDFPGFLHVGLTELGTDNFASLVQLYQAAPAGAAIATYVAKVCLVNVSDTVNLTDAAEFARVGIGLINSVNSQSVEAGISFNDGIATDADKMPHGPTAQSDGINGFTTSVDFPSLTPGEWVYIRLRKTTGAAYTSANTYEMDFSMNGIVWHNFASGSKTFTTACDRVGIILRRPKSATGTPKVEALVDFFRRTV